MKKKKNGILSTREGRIIVSLFFAVLVFLSLMNIWDKYCTHESSEPQAQPSPVTASYTPGRTADSADMSS